MQMDATSAMLAYQTQKKETVVAFLLWFFLGPLGAHRMYCNRVGSGVAMLLIALVSFPLMFVFIGFLSYIGVMIWWLVDAFLLSGWIQQHNYWVAARIEQARHALPEQSVTSPRPVS